MHNESLLSIIQHINWLKLMKNYQVRHYMWEMAKILIPALLTGLITFTAMRIIDNKNKKRWLNDGHLKRKTELEIEIRKFLLGIKANTLNDYKLLADWYETRDNEETDSRILYDFNKNFKNLVKYLSEEKEESNHHYKKIFALLDEYECYSPKIKKLFSDFRNLHNKIIELETINFSENNFLEEVNKEPEHFNEMINAYLCFQIVIESILKKLTVKRLK